jgi:hypothetical protein
MYAIFWSETLNGRNNLGDLGVDGRIILKWRDIGSEDVNWIYLAQYSVWWRFLVKEIKKLQDPYKVGNVFTT